MSHDHSKHNSLTVAFWLNAIFTVIEFIGGIYSNSSAIIADAVHDLGDTLAIGFGVWMEKYSKKPANSSFHFGYKRYSILSALFLSIFLIVGSLLMIYHASLTFFDPLMVKSDVMIYLAILGVIINGLGFYKIWKSGKQHGHNSKIVMLHLLEDVLGWIAVLIGGLLIYFTSYYWIDPLLTCTISIFILWRSIPNLIETMTIFLQKSPSVLTEKIYAEILKIPKISAIPKLKIWTLDGNSHVANLVVQSTGWDSEMIREVRKILEKFHIYESTIEVDPS